MQTGKITALYVRFSMMTELTQKAAALNIRSRCSEAMPNLTVLPIFLTTQMTDIQAQISIAPIFSVCSVTFIKDLSPL